MDVYPAWLRWRGTLLLIGWTPGVGDGPDLVLTRAGRLRIFRSEQDLADSTAALGGELISDAEVVVHDLSYARSWAHSASTSVDCTRLLNIWNLAEDIGASIGKRFDAGGPRALFVYDKLFYGNNIPAVTPLGRQYVPLWRPAELVRLRRIMRDATSLLARAIDAAVIDGSVWATTRRSG